MRLWEQNPVDWQAGHGISHNLGGADVIILQSTHRDQIQSARLDRRGAVSKDEYYNIGGIAVDPLTAWDILPSWPVSLDLESTPIHGGAIIPRHRRALTPKFDQPDSNA